ncbi:MAG: RnfABCDGE type electron transport complex subunit D [Anaerohalosphaeraceae bacterium]
MLSKITVSPAPHISQPLSTQRVMLDVLIGLAFPMAAAIWFFRQYAILLLICSVGSCMISEWLVNVLRKKPNSLSDLSAVVTGVILAFSLPPAAPWWVAIMGGAFAILIVKMLYGGLGYNVFNPAMAARVFLAISFGTLMQVWTVPATVKEGALKEMTAANTHATTQATAMAWSKEAQKGLVPAKEVSKFYKDSFFGTEGGCLGETSALAILLGGVYMLFRKTITWRIPAMVLISAAVVATAGWLIKPAVYVNPVYHLVGGGMMLCAFFIATDPVTSPLTVKGELIFGVGVGVLIMLIRILGEYPEGVMYAVLIMNALTPLIDRATRLIPAGGKPHVQ